MNRDWFSANQFDDIHFHHEVHWSTSEYNGGWSFQSTVVAHRVINQKIGHFCPFFMLYTSFWKVLLPETPFESSWIFHHREIPGFHTQRENDREG